MLDVLLVGLVVLLLLLLLRRFVLFRVKTSGRQRRCSVRIFDASGNVKVEEDGGRVAENKNR